MSQKIWSLVFKLVGEQISLNMHTLVSCIVILYFRQFLPLIEAKTQTLPEISVHIVYRYLRVVQFWLIKKSLQNSQICIPLLYKVAKQSVYGNSHILLNNNNIWNFVFSWVLLFGHSWFVMFQHHLNQLIYFKNQQISDLLVTLKCHKSTVTK